MSVLTNMHQTIVRGRLGAILLLAIVAASAALSACSSDVRPPSSIVEARSNKERVTEPDVTTEDLTKLVRGNSTFAFDLYRLLSAGDGNLFLSPYSISAALAMTYAGARSETEQEMAEALSIPLPQERLHPGFNSLDLALTTKPELSEDQLGDPLQISIANAVWGERQQEFLPGFLDTLAENYGAGLQLLDFISDFEAARRTINDWVRDATEQRVPELLEQGVIDAMTRLVLTNAIYFNASWLNPFPPEDTQDDAFHLIDGNVVQTPMMHIDERIGYGEVDGVRVVQLLYEGLTYGMYVLLPPEGEFKAFEARLNAELLDTIIGEIRDAQVELTMPKFEFEAAFDLPDALQELGMVSAFLPSEADFSGMDGARDLFISDVVHMALIAVDEAGTEAAAATGVVVSITSAPQPVVVALDRPFLFVIRHVDTDTILFLGRVLDPTA